LIAAQKIKAISNTYSPLCNFCGNVCDSRHWYKKIAPAASFTKEGESALKQLKEHNSIHQTLKQLTSSYIVCKECFDLGNYPKSLSESDFEQTSLVSLLQSQEFKFEKGDLEEEQDEWTEQEVECLINAISEHQNDWDTISRISFKSKKTAEQCVFKFLCLPLTESMLAHVKKPKQNS
jgi:hypothetical protein